MADKKIATDGSSSEEEVQDQKIMAELWEKYKDALASKAAKEKKRISEKNIVDLSMVAENVKLEQGAESTGSDSKGDVNVKEMTTAIESDSDVKGSVTGEGVGATMGTDEKEAEKDSIAGDAKACKEADKEAEI